MDTIAEYWNSRNDSAEQQRRGSYVYGLRLICEPTIKMIVDKLVRNPQNLDLLEKQKSNEIDLISEALETNLFDLDDELREQCMQYLAHCLIR